MTPPKFDPEKTKRRTIVHLERAARLLREGNYHRATDSGNKAVELLYNIELHAELAITERSEG